VLHFLLVYIDSFYGRVHTVFLVPAVNLYEMINVSPSACALQVANAMAAKAKLLLRELKTVKADLAFAKERCAQLEEENKLLRECRDKGDTLEDDDLVFSSSIDELKL